MLFQILDELVAMAGNPLAGFPDDRDRIFLSFGGDKQFRIRKLEFDHVSGNIDIRIAEQFLDQRVHERVPLALDEEPRLVLFELKYFDNHAPMFGNLTLLKYG